MLFFILEIKLTCQKYYKIKREYGGVISPGHNAGVIGNEPLVAIDFTGLKTLLRKVEAIK